MRHLSLAYSGKAGIVSGVRVSVCLFASPPKKLIKNTNNKLSGERTMSILGSLESA